MFLVGGLGEFRERICVATNDCRVGDDTFDLVTVCSDKGLKFKSYIILWEQITFFCFWLLSYRRLAVVSTS